MTTNPISVPSEMDYDLVDLQTLSVDRQAIHGEAVLCDLGGGLQHVFFVLKRGETSVTLQPMPYTSAGALLWLEMYGMADLFDDAREALQAHGDWLSGKDVMGELIGFSWDDRSQS